MSSIPIEKLRDLFVRPGHVGQADFADAVKESERSKVTVERVLVERGLVTDENLGRTIADGFDIHFVDLTKVKPADELLEMIPEVAARAQQAVIFERSNGVFKVATTNPDNYEFFRLLERNTGLKVELYYASPLGLEEALRAEWGPNHATSRQQLNGIPGMPRRARRWVGEMEEIAKTYAGLGLTPRILEGAADMYRFIGDTSLAEQTSREADPTLDEILDVLAGRLTE